MFQLYYLYLLTQDKEQTRGCSWCCCFCLEAGCQRCFTTSSEVNIASDRHKNLSKKMSVFHDLGHAIRVKTTRYVNLHQSRTHPRVGDKEELHQMFWAHLCLPSPHMQEPGRLVQGYINSVAKLFIRKKMLSTCSSCCRFS